MRLIYFLVKFYVKRQTIMRHVVDKRVGRMVTCVTMHECEVCCSFVCWPCECACGACGPLKVSVPCDEPNKNKNFHLYKLNQQLHSNYANKTKQRKEREAEKRRIDTEKYYGKIQISSLYFILSLIIKHTIEYI